MSRLFGNRGDERAAMRPLWQRVVELARAKGWYSDLGVEDSLAGRFDMVTLVLATILLRMEREEGLAKQIARLTEIFVEDMDGQLRQSGIGDPTVGKHVRKLVTTLGGRLGALREALPQGENALTPVLERNVTTTPGCDHASMARAVLSLHLAIDAVSADALLAGDFAFEPL